MYKRKDWSSSLFSVFMFWISHFKPWPPRERQTPNDIMSLFINAVYGDGDGVEILSSLLHTPSTTCVSQNGPLGANTPPKATVGQRTTVLVCLTSAGLLDQSYCANYPQVALVDDTNVHPHPGLSDPDMPINYYSRVLVVCGGGPNIYYYSCLLYTRWNGQEHQVCLDGYSFTAAIILPPLLIYMAVFIIIECALLSWSSEIIARKGRESVVRAKQGRMRQCFQLSPPSIWTDFYHQVLKHNELEFCLVIT